MALLLGVPASVCAAQEASPATAPSAKPQAAALPEPSVAQLRLAPGLRAELFASEPHMANPVAISFDEKGKLYLVEAFRRRAAVLDIRKLPDWLDDDLACRTVADRIAMVKRRLKPEELAKLSVGSDRVRLLEDRDGDGRVDHDSVFAEGFNNIEDGTAAGVLARDGQVWLTNIPSLWRLRDADGDGIAEVKDRLHYGYGVRYNFSGHDLHGLRFGPDGRLYFSIADRGLHVVGDDGRTIVSNPDSGAVLRCNPDGSGLELFHTGLRNPQELAFNEFGDLFTCDNNSDGGDATRWVHVVEGGDSGWHVGHQWNDFPVARGAWNAERLWDPNPTIPAYYRLPPIANPKVSGPSGLTYDPGVSGLPEAFRGRFLVVDFRGAPAGGSGVYVLKNKPKGATFELVEQKELVSNILPTDVEFGPDGGVYVTDWISGWEPTGKGRIYRLSDPAAVRDPAVAETRKLIAEGMRGRSVDEVAKLLGHADVRVRQAAQFALAEGGPVSMAAFAPVAARSTNQLARIHAIWGMGQIGRKHPAVLDALLPMLGDADPEIRAQVARVLSDARGETAYEFLLKVVADPSPRVRFYVALALGKLENQAAVPHLLTMLEANADADAYVRHAAVVSLARLNDLAALRAASTHKSPAVRMGVLLAMRRQGNRDIALFLKDATPEIVLEAARAINDETLAAAGVELAAVLSRKPGELPPAMVVPILSRALNANYRLGTPNAAKAVAAFAARDASPEPLRIEALRMLAMWSKPGGRDRITGLWRPLHERDELIVQGAFEPVLDGILRGAPDAVRIAALSAATATGVTPTPLLELVTDAKSPPGLRAAAIGALAEQKSPSLPEAAKAGLADASEEVRRAAIRVQAKLPGGLKPLAPLLETGSPREQQAILQSLSAVTGKEADAMLLGAFARLGTGKLPPEAHLDLLSAAATRKSGPVKDALAKHEAARPQSDPLAAFREALVGGDAANGGRIFRDRADVSCIRCHAIATVGGNAGPDLAGLAKRATREHILESILLPNAKIAPGFETVQVRTAADDIVVGVLKTEDDKALRIEVPEQGVVTIDKAKVKRRKGGLSAMPEDVAKTLSKSDVRDLVEFLAAQ